MEEKTRNEIDSKYKWDLTKHFKNDNELYEELKKLSIKLEEAEKYEGHILDSASNLYKILKLDMEISMRKEKAYIYSNLKWHEDLSNQIYQEMQAKVSDFSQKASKILSFIEPEILKSDYSEILKLIKENSDLDEFAFYLERLFRAKEHFLSKEEEKMLSELSGITENFSQSSEYIRDEIIDYGFIKDEDNKKIKLTSANISLYLTSPNEQVRKETYEAVNKEYKKFHSALATNYIGSVKTDVWASKKRKFKNSLSASLFSSNISEEVYNRLIEEGKKGAKAYQKYLKILAKVLKKDKLEPHNTLAKLYNEKGRDYSFEEAKKIILDAFKIYGDEYQQVLNKVFDERWIDVFHNKNKRTGWYSWECYDAHPVILANYNSKYYDVSSLAHEIGHTVQGYLSAKNNTYQDYANDQIEWEIPSITNELVLGKYLLKTTNNIEDKKDILNNMIEIFLGNFYGGIKGAEFEKIAHETIEKGDSLSPSSLSKIWEKVVTQYNNDIVVPSEYTKYGYNKISHFYNDYYYYLYAVGVAIASYLSEEIVSGNKELTSKYLQYLKLGGRNYSLENLKLAGIDVTDPKVYQKAIESFEKNLDEFEKLLDK